MERERSTSQRVLTEEMTSGHPEASGLAGCLGKPRAHLMTLAWTTSHRFVFWVFFLYLRLQTGNNNGLVKLKGLVSESWCQARNFARGPKEH